MIVPGFEAAKWPDAVFAVLVLTVVRMLSVAFALAGSGFDKATVASIGWFGPRGLASVVFGLIAADSLAPPDAQLVLGAVTTTVTLSVIAHGVTASPLAERYGRITHQFHPGRLEHQPAAELSTRRLSTGPRAVDPGPAVTTLKEAKPRGRQSEGR